MQLCLVGLRSPSDLNEALVVTTAAQTTRLSSLGFVMQ